jgi:hypothetical protein
LHWTAWRGTFSREQPNTRGQRSVSLSQATIGLPSLARYKLPAKQDTSLSNRTSRYIQGAGDV